MQTITTTTELPQDTAQALAATLAATREVIQWDHDLERLTWTTTNLRCMATTDTGRWCNRRPMVGAALCRMHTPGQSPPGTPLPKVPAGPLVDAVTARGIILNQQSKTIERAYHRAKRNGHLTLAAADQLSTELLGEHPATIWGDAWWTADAQAPEHDANGTPLPKVPKVPAGPLVDAVTARGITVAHHSRGVRSAYYRARRNGRLTLAAADQLAGELLRRHPAAIWGDAWRTADAPQDHTSEVA